MALRLDFVPFSFSLSQRFSPLTSLRRSEGGSLRLTIRRSRSPSLSKSPKAQPRLECAALTPGPPSSNSSSNLPLPRLRNSTRRGFRGYSGALLRAPPSSNAPPTLPLPRLRNSPRRVFRGYSGNLLSTSG